MSIHLQAYDGVAICIQTRRPPPHSWSRVGWRVNAWKAEADSPYWKSVGGQHGAIRAFDELVFLPLWYAALVFAIAGIGALRLGRRFTLRSAIIATTVVAGLLGMVVAL